MAIAAIVGRPANRLVRCQTEAHAFRMFMVDEETATAIRHAYEEGGELLAVVELRRHFPGIADNANAPLCARAIASWTERPPVIERRVPKKRRRPAR